MSLLCISMIQKNRIIFIILLLIFALLSVYMPHGVYETHAHHDFESLFKLVINNNKPAANIKRLLKKLRAFLIRLFMLPQILLSVAVLISVRLRLFKRLISSVLIIHLYSILCLYFHGGKYKGGNLTKATCLSCFEISNNTILRLN